MLLTHGIVKVKDVFYKQNNRLQNLKKGGNGMLALSLSFIIVAVGFFGIVIVLVRSNTLDFKKNLLCLMFVMFTWIGGLLGGHALKSIEIESEKASKALLMNVPVSGVYVEAVTFRMIIHKRNGELDKIELVPATTKKEEK